MSGLGYGTRTDIQPSVLYDGRKGIKEGAHGGAAPVNKRGARVMRMHARLGREKRGGVISTCLCDVAILRAYGYGIFPSGYGGGDVRVVVAL